MPNLLTGLKYQAPYEEVETEQELLEVFADLKEQYSRLSSNFKIFTARGRQIRSFRDFLRYATRDDNKKYRDNDEGELVILRGSGDISGLVVKNASLEYDLSQVEELTRLWDDYRDNTCNSCQNLGKAPEEDAFCNDRTISKPRELRFSSACYRPLRKNSEGKAARKLDELVEEAAR